MPVPLPRRLFTVDDYYRMAEVGILQPGERVELLEGEIVQLGAIGSRHAGCVNRLTRILVTGVGEHALVTVQNPVRLSDLSEPQPDLAVVRPRPGDYMDRHPLPDDVLLVVEVADTSIPVDRERKAPLYATARVPEYWIVDLPGEVLEVHRDPEGGAYRSVTRHRKGEILNLVQLPELAVPVEEMLP